MFHKYELFCKYETKLYHDCFFFKKIFIPSVNYIVKNVAYTESL